MSVSNLSGLLIFVSILLFGIAKFIHFKMGIYRKSKYSDTDEYKKYETKIILSYKKDKKLWEEYLIKDNIFYEYYWWIIVLDKTAKIFLVLGFILFFFIK